MVLARSYRRTMISLTGEEFCTGDVSVDGQRFLINENVEQNAPPVDIILNWASSLKK